MSTNITSNEFKLNKRRAKYYNIQEILNKNELNGSGSGCGCNCECGYKKDEKLIKALNDFDVLYRATCGILFNYVPKSGHPGGSISSGHFVQSLLFHSMNYDFKNPDAKDADLISYAAGHKAMGLYSAWALRNECMKVAAKDLMPDERHQLRIEDLLGFRRNPTTETPLYNKHKARSLDGHPAPLTPFVKLSTGASGVGITTSVGLAFGALDSYGADNAPWIHIIEGEGGLTPGRVQEMLAGAASAQIKNAIVHVDWNQASIDSNKVCREGDNVGDYVQWDPCELFYLNDWNVIFVADGFDYNQVLAAQYLAINHINKENNQPTAIIYRTTKGWKYGIEGRLAHGAGHEFCSNEFYKFLSECESHFGVSFPRFNGDKAAANVEKYFFDSLMVLREICEKNKGENGFANVIANELRNSRDRLQKLGRKLRADAPKLHEAIYNDQSITPANVPNELKLAPGKSVTLRGVLGDTLNYLNKKSGGAIVASAADLFGSTSINNVAAGLSEGYFNLEKNPKARLIMIGGICEDAMGGFMAGLSTFGNHIGVGSSYGAFIAALQHVPARLHAIGQEARKHYSGEAYNPFFIVCAHAGPKTGEDGPTHADPQALQLLAENFPKGTAVTLTPMGPDEIWPLTIAALKARVAVISPFISRPAENVIDRAKLGFPDASMAASGLYALRKANTGKRIDGTLVIQGNSVSETFIFEVLPKLDNEKLNLNIYYVSSAELFDMLPEQEKLAIFPEEHAMKAMGITEFTMPTMYRWITSEKGRKYTIHTFKKGHFMGSGQAHKVLEEAGLNAEGQFKAIMDYVNNYGSK
ncbi:MAG: hypothetical protein HQK49_16115 [Oligoflexia bacterium]|nr:hypothetical protein [Oligoflexia bacterium]